LAALTFHTLPELSFHIAWQSNSRNRYEVQT